MHSLCPDVFGVGISELPQEGILLACFNQLYKIDPSVRGIESCRNVACQRACTEIPFGSTEFLNAAFAGLRGLDAGLDFASMSELSCTV